MREGYAWRKKFDGIEKSYIFALLSLQVFSLMPC